ncbi:MAG: hypothetical protein RR356_00200, partial [Bacteroidales bacterium]
MKKLFAILAVAAFVFAACGPKAEPEAVVEEPVVEEAIVEEPVVEADTTATAVAAEGTVNVQ